MSHYNISLYIAFGLLGFIALIIFYFAVLNLRWVNKLVINTKAMNQWKEWFIQLCTLPEIEEEKAVTNSPDVVSVIYTSESYLKAIEYAKTISTDDLLALYNRLDYPAFGFGALQIYKRTEGGKWSVINRNEQNWKDKKEDCDGSTLREALIKHYAYCVASGFLPKPKYK